MIIILRIGCRAIVCQLAIGIEIAGDTIRPIGGSRAQFNGTAAKLALCSGSLSSGARIQHIAAHIRCGGSSGTCIGAAAHSRRCVGRDCVRSIRAHFERVTARDRLGGSSGARIQRVAAHGRCHVSVRLHGGGACAQRVAARGHRGGARRARVGRVAARERRAHERRQK